MRSLVGQKLVIATHNKGKLVEISHLLAPYGVEVLGAAELGLEEPEETESTYAGNARIKAHAAAKATGFAALSDDSGISVDALDGAPGVFTADWAETETGRDFVLAMTKVENLLQEKGPDAPRTAAFNATLCLAWPDGEDVLFVGKVEGTLVWPLRGDRGFGFDPMFQPLGHDITFGEMDPDQKHTMSHRAVAFDKMVKACFGG